VTSYYNEIDPYAAQWLRNLIAEGLIAKGDVDERSIKDVRGSDLAGYTQCHFFAGIGGWSYALRLAGWPDSEPVWTGSCPCQPLSSAGQRKGHADERHLWPAFHALIAERRPATVFGEQVASKDGREWLAGVRADLEALGYALGAADLCAASAGAPHIRQRIFWLADAEPGRLPSGIFRFANERANLFASHDCQTVQAEGGRQARYGESPLPLVDHGVSADVAASEALGNAIVPQVAAAFIECTMTATAPPPQRGTL
jgi:DNA (cytosine-5)-methyltransferase 1